MRKKLVIVLMSGVFALSLVLVGCGGGNAEDAKKAFQGTWVLTEFAQDGQVTSSDDIETLRSLGMEVYLNLNGDGTAKLVLFNEVTEGTWEAANGTTGTLVVDGNSAEMKLNDSKLTFEKDGASLTLERGEPKASSSAAASSSSSASSSSRS